MNWLYMIYFALGAVLCFGARLRPKGEWSDSLLPLKQSKALQGYTALLIAFHHMSQKTGAPWHAPQVVVHGLDAFVDVGYWYVGVFLFCSGYGLYKSVTTRPDYLKGLG